MIIRILIFIVLCNSQTTLSQTHCLLGKGLTIGFTNTFESFEDNRFTYKKRKDFGFNINLKYYWSKANSRQSVELRFGKNHPSRKGEMVTFVNLKPSALYTYEYSLRDLFLGSYIEAGSLLSFPNGRWEGNNTISYTIWSSLGISLGYDKQLSSDHGLVIFSKLRLPILNYVIRPSYGLPYPDKFLVDGTFNFQRENMTRYVLTSGKINTVNKFQNFLFEVGFSKGITKKKNHQIQLSYTMEYLKLNEVKDVKHLKNGLQLLYTYNFSKND